MANQYTLDNDFAAIAEPQGTLYNVGDSAIELADADTVPKGQGILLMTGERRTFSGTLYARSMDAAALLNVSDFTEAGEGGDVSDVRRPSTAYTAGALVDGAGLASGLVLRCTTAGTTSSAALDCSGYDIGDTITDGTATWLVTEYVTIDANGGIPTNIYIPGAFNKKETFTTSGTFVAPVTGTYRITLQGGGGGGGGAGTGQSVHHSGGGGGQGGHYAIYTTLTAGASYSYTVGAGGTGGAAGSSSSAGANGTSGGSTSIEIDGVSYLVTGGAYGFGSAQGGMPGFGGVYRINETIIYYVGAPGGAGSPGSAFVNGGNGGGIGGSEAPAKAAHNGGGGCGGRIQYNGTYDSGGAGGDGYITFEYYDTNA